MNGLFLNIILATSWVFLTGSFDVSNYLFGFAIGYLVIALVHRLSPTLEGYPRKIPLFITFLCYFARELVVSNVRVAFDIVTGPWQMKPGVIGFKTSGLNDFELTALSNLISLTPGTLVLDISEDKTTLFVHAMFTQDEDELQQDLRKLERRLLEVIR